jgi:hypothetical protein
MVHVSMVELELELELKLELGTCAHGTLNFELSLLLENLTEQPLLLNFWKNFWSETWQGTFHLYFRKPFESHFFLSEFLLGGYFFLK